MYINQHFKKILLYLSFFFYVLSVSAETINIGVQAPRSAVKALTKWRELGNYLKVELGTKIKIIPLNPSVTIDAVEKEKVDFILANPAITVAIKEKYHAIPFATMNKKHGSLFSGVIISKKGSGINTAADLKGKKIITYKKKSAAAYVFQVKYLMDKGINISDFASIKIAKKQDDIVLAIKAGLFDAGFVKSGLLESMAAEGKIKIDDVDIVDKKTDSLVQLHSTALYPQWCFSAITDKGKTLMDKMKTALVKLSSDSAAAKKAKIVGFVPLKDLSVMAETLKALKMSPYD